MLSRGSLNLLLSDDCTTDLTPLVLQVCSFTKSNQPGIIAEAFTVKVSDGMTSTEAYLASSLVHCVNTILPLSACTITSCTTSVVMGQRRLLIRAMTHLTYLPAILGAPVPYEFQGPLLDRAHTAVNAFSSLVPSCESQLAALARITDSLSLIAQGGMQAVDAANTATRTDTTSKALKYDVLYRKLIKMGTSPEHVIEHLLRLQREVDALHKERQTWVERVQAEPKAKPSPPSSVRSSSASSSGSHPSPDTSFDHLEADEAPDILELRQKLGRLERAHRQLQADHEILLRLQGDRADFEYDGADKVDGSAKEDQAARVAELELNNAALQRLADEQNRHIVHLTSERDLEQALAHEVVGDPVPESVKEEEAMVKHLDAFLALIETVFSVTADIPPSTSHIIRLLSGLRTVGSTLLDLDTDRVKLSEPAVEDFVGAMATLLAHAVDHLRAQSSS